MNPALALPLNHIEAFEFEPSFSATDVWKIFVFPSFSFYNLFQHGMFKLSMASFSWFHTSNWDDPWLSVARVPWRVTKANANTCLVAALIHAWQGEVSKSKQDRGLPGLLDLYVLYIVNDSHKGGKWDIPTSLFTQFLSLVHWALGATRFVLFPAAVVSADQKNIFLWQGILL
jgi:hypothetical protein